MEKPENEQHNLSRIAEEVRQACIEAAREGYRDASMSGLCADGAIEAAIGAIQSLDLKKVLETE